MSFLIKLSNQSKTCMIFTGILYYSLTNIRPGWPNYRCQKLGVKIISKVIISKRPISIASVQIQV